MTIAARLRAAAEAIVARRAIWVRLQLALELTRQRKSPAGKMHVSNAARHTPRAYIRDVYEPWVQNRRQFLPVH